MSQAVINAAAQTANVLNEHHYNTFYENPEFWVGLAFIFVVLALSSPISKVIKGMIQNKIEGIKNRLTTSEQLLEDAQKLLSDYEKKLRNAKKEAADIAEKSKRQIEYIKTANLSKLEQEMRNKEKEAEERINAAKENADKEFTELASALSIKIVKQAIQDNLSHETQSKLIDKSIQAIGKLN